MFSPWPFIWWLNEATRLPVVMSNANTLFASTSPAPPTGTPGGRARVNSPVTYAVLPTTTESQTTPLTCQVGRPSADTVAGVPGAGAVSAEAPGDESATSPPTMRLSVTGTKRSRWDMAPKNEVTAVVPLFPRGRHIRRRKD